LTPSFERNPITQEHEILSLKARVLGAAHSKDFVILSVAVLIQCQGVTNGQDGRTNGQTPRRWLRREKHYMLSHVIKHVTST